MKRYLEKDPVTGSEKILTAEDLMATSWRRLADMEVEALNNGEEIFEWRPDLASSPSLTRIPEIYLFHIRADDGQGGDLSYDVLAEDAGQALWIYMLNMGDLEDEHVLDQIRNGEISPEQVMEAIEWAEEKVDWNDLTVFQRPLSPTPHLIAWKSNTSDNEVTLKAKAGFVSRRDAAFLPESTMSA